MAVVQDIAQGLVDLGFLDVILPFMFVFGIVFAMLQKTKVFGTVNGKPKTNINAMVSFVIGFAFVASLERVEVLTLVLQRLGLVLIGILSLLLIMSFFGKEVSFLKYRYTIFLLFVVVVMIFGTSLKWFSLDDISLLVDWLINPIFIGALIFILVLWFLVRDTSKKVEAKHIKTSEKSPEIRPRGEPQRKKEETTVPSSGPEFVKEIPGEELQSGEEGDILWKE